MSFIKPVLLRATAVVLFAALGSGPGAAQFVTSPEPVPMIDLDAVLEAPAGPSTTGVRSDQAPAPSTAPTDTTAPADTTIAPPPVMVAEPLQNEILDESLLTVPIFDRGDSQQSTAQNPMAGLLLPLVAKHTTLDGIVRLTGEVQSATFYVDLPQAADVQNFVLSYRISINVLPSDSEMLVRVNGVDTPIIHPNAFDGFAPVELPSTLLTEGRNEIVVSMHHTHRIFCGPAATFDIWTEINTNLSGVRIAQGDLPTDPIGMVMALRAQVAMSGNLPVRLINDIVSGSTTEDSVLNNDVLNALTPRLAGLRGGSPIILAPEKPYAVQNGGAPLARISVIYGPLPSVDIRRGGDGTVVLLLTLGFDGTLPDLDGILPLPSPLENNALLPPDTATPLRDLQFTQTEAHNRYSEQQVIFRLPEDWLLLASQKGLLRLNYSFLDGLPKGALMLVKMNDTTIRMLPLDIDGGKTQPTLDVGFRAGLLRPGPNVLTFATIVPGDPPNLPCPMLPAPLVTIGDDSTLLAPPSPRMQMSDLARPMAALRPDQIRSDEIATANRDIAYFPTVLAAALRPIAQTDRIADASLNITVEGTDEYLNLTDLGVNRRDLLQLFQEPVPVDENAEPVEEPTEAEASMFGQAIAFVKATATQIRQLAIPDDGTLASWLEGRKAEAVLFIPRDDAPDDVWLMVRPQSDPQFLAAVLAQSRLSPVGPRGRLSILTADGDWQSWRSSTPAPRLLDTLTIRNIRTVAGNYASWSPLLYGTILMVLTLISVGFALVYILTTRGKRKR